jgi:glycosyltransferase involved in cell wall biosynthesis
LTSAEVQTIQPQFDRGLSERPQVIFIGRLAEEKGLTNLLKAFDRVSAYCKNKPQLTLLGDGPERRHLEQLAGRLACRASIHFAGQVNRIELSRRLLAADLCVQPSLTEGFSKAWLDAMVHGLPVICSDVGAARSVIGENGDRGWLVRPGDEEGLAARLSAVLSDSIDWPSLRRRCREFAEARTLERWREDVGAACAQRWQWIVRDGKLVR